MGISDYFTQDKLIDSHCHLNFKDYTNTSEVIKRAVQQGVQMIYDTGTDLESSKRAVKNAKENPGVVFAYLGLDPEVFIPDSQDFIGFDKKEAWFEGQFSGIEKLLTENKELVKGFGETGLDYYWIEKSDITAEQKEQSKKLQMKLFEMHLELAGKYRSHLTVHSRGAEKACLEVALKYPNVFGIFHSYTGDSETAKQVLDAGWGLGVNGIVTFKNAEILRNLYRKLLGKISPDWSYIDFYKKGIFFETDSPFLSPEGKRGEVNEPGNVRMIFERFRGNLL